MEGYDDLICGVRFEKIKNLKTLCQRIIQNPKDGKTILELKNFVDKSPISFIKHAQPIILATFYPIFKSILENKSSYNNNEKQIIVDLLKSVLDKCSIDNLGLFFNIYVFLLFEIYDNVHHKVFNINEEYKLSIMLCMISLAKSVSQSLIALLYTKENAPKLCQMLYVALEVAKNEKLRSLRISAIDCLMSIIRVLNDSDFNEMREETAELFSFFLPGIASGLRQIALEDEKIGHKVPMTALKAWGRIVTLLMKPSASLENSNLSDKNKLIASDVNESFNPKQKRENDIKSYLEKITRTPQWFKDSDKKLQTIVVHFTKLTYHPHEKVRLELIEMASVIINNCLTTMPISISHLIEIVVILSEDESLDVSSKSCFILSELSCKLEDTTFNTLLENSEEGFYNGINSLPRKFNGIDEKEQLASLNLITGYLRLFGRYNLTRVLLSSAHLNKLMLTLLHISELEKNNVSLLEEYTIKDLNLSPDLRTPWKRFRYFKDGSIILKLEYLFRFLGSCGVFRILSDFLLDVIMFKPEHRKEAIFILNETILDIVLTDENLLIIKHIINTYTDSSYWCVPLTVMVDEFGNEHTLADVQNNVIQVCLLVEGIGKIALALKDKFRVYMLKILYLVLERAGSGHALVRAAGLTALTNVTVACNYNNITELINNNIDYFTYTVERKLNKSEDNESVLNVLGVVLKYSHFHVLQSLANIINEVLLQSCDKFKEKNATAFLNIFNIFVKRLIKWLNIDIKIEPIKSKADKLKVQEHFKVSGIDNSEVDFSDNIMGKTAEEMWNEDIEKKQEELNLESDDQDVKEFKKPDPPMHIKLTVAILSRSLHFLPSKDRARKLIVLEILIDGLEIIRDYEDDLLPIVHQIWSPLTQRFKEFKDPLIINYSFHLLVTLARLSKDFIRLRTTKDVLPNILLVLENFSKESYLKDKGSTYRYSQAFKLQLALLENLGRLLVDLDASETILIQIIGVVFKYLNNNQPIPLQEASLDFFKTLFIYDSKFLEKHVKLLEEDNKSKEFEKNLLILCKLLTLEK